MFVPPYIASIVLILLVDSADVPNDIVATPFDTVVVPLDTPFNLRTNFPPSTGLLLESKTFAFKVKVLSF